MKNCKWKINQNGKAKLSSEDSLMVIWNNLTGKNMKSKKEYSDYMDFALSHGFEKGEIELVVNGEIKDKFIIL